MFMANDLIPLMKPKIDFIIDKKFYPAVLWNHSFLDAVHNSTKSRASTKRRISRII